MGAVKEAIQAQIFLRRGVEEMSENSALQHHSESVAIVGIGGIFPGAPHLEQFWDNIRNGRSAAREVPDGRWLLPPTRPSLRNRA